MGGIYQIRNLVNGKRYIGSAVDFKRRWHQHKHILRKGTHHSKHLQAAWNKYGEAAFVFEIIIECEQEDLIGFEQLCLDDESPEYNICKVAGSSLGQHWKLTEETKKKMSKAKRKYSDKYKKEKRGYDYLKWCLYDSGTKKAMREENYFYYEKL